jgi:hypothetical protein
MRSADFCLPEGGSNRLNQLRLDCERRITERRKPRITIAMAGNELTRVGFSEESGFVTQNDTGMLTVYLT